MGFDASVELVATGDTSFFTNHWPTMTRFKMARKARNPELTAKAFSAPWGDCLNLDDPTPPDTCRPPVSGPAGSMARLRTSRAAT